MSLSVTTRFPGGNAADIEILQNGDIPEIRFASDPCGGTEALWFYFRMDESAPDPNRQTKIRITWKHVENMTGATDMPLCIPVSAIPGRNWARLKQGEETRTPDGLRQLSWLIPHPSPSLEVALCFPYNETDITALMERSSEFWSKADLGVSQSGFRISRYHNTLGAPGSHHPGFYLLARQHAGETPGSWVLDGLYRYWSQTKKGGYMIWSVPFVDMDGMTWGHYGRDGFPLDMERAWGEPPQRHETRIIQQDMLRWRSRCRPSLVLDFQAPGVSDRDGVFAYAGQEGESTFAEETKWCNVIKHELQAEFAAPDFLRKDTRPHRLANPTFAHFVRNTWGLPVLSLQIPYSQAAGNVLTQKSYREIGKRIGQALHRRNG